jgi:hypothetical protein
MKLYLVHCGFYDSEVCDGLYESHVNFFVVAESFETARAKAKQIPEFQNKKMHVDGLQEIQSIGGYHIKPEYDAMLENKSTILNHKHRDLAPKLPSQATN